MGRARTCFAALVAGFLLANSALGQDTPDAARLKRASDEFDLGVAALKAKRFDEAAQHFEAADEAVPTAKSMRLAIRARSEAGQSSRAATLAARALDRYPNDADTAQLAKETMAKLSPTLHRLDVRCLSPCVIAVGPRIVPGTATTAWTLFLDPGKTQVSASFFGNLSSKPSTVDAKAGETSTLRLEPRGDTTPVPTSTATATPTATSTSTPTATSTSDPELPPTGTTVPDKPPPPKGIHPALFITGLVLTAGAGGVTIWSGIDTLQNPGKDKVRTACAGKGTDCPEYQQGLQSQLRTNILIGATAGAGALTVLTAIFTRWKSPPADASSAAKKEGDVSIAPVIEVGPQGAFIGARGEL